ncbi:Pyruvate phosphate dikinase, PEP/pyruvate binding domain [Streptoalloteichus tenebrarius]|uniref:Phosphoenolpyruvate synthase n=1 Tax=Streptoalloteichus tenebrarius (strain ATCC 17920 / DSM 40477 / JCM 4838 / CBS 697.72 / NBRC 16177 / NCIMB 11028 / NRRL B-12390 / A12253. 1 / ISP 5477) TaxID=1933 RepID=A0ABT1I0E3_STRSD|nr:PEP/pyruvate-binding domain-containing protein [Streptoalloteichus tenebrarius]MCP2261229.1 Pyruvate phosphate dikinase, PEP/pyruvate binding domain [Streptoalloteichus tenebrarius]BFF04421.1 hypothetical protein GCM10020241_60960 [Streptoalloteichus tenebrarius]
MSYVRWLDQLDGTDVGIAGGRGACLGELVATGWPVPAGFVVTTESYLRSLADSGSREELRQTWRAATAVVGQPDQLAEQCRQLVSIVRTAGMSGPVRQAVLDAYHHLGENAWVIVGSSVVAGDGGQVVAEVGDDPVAEVRGDEALLRAVRDRWAALFRPEAVARRVRSGRRDEPLVAVIVQRGAGRPTRETENGTAGSAGTAGGRAALVSVDLEGVVIEGRRG